MQHFPKAKCQREVKFIMGDSFNLEDRKPTKLKDDKHLQSFLQNIMSLKLNNIWWPPTHKFYTCQQLHGLKHQG